MPPRKRPASKQPGRPSKRFAAPFKTPLKTKEEDDFSKLAQTPGTPVLDAETPVKSEQTPVKSEQTPVKSEQTPVKSEQKPAIRAVEVKKVSNRRQGKRKITEAVEEKTPTNTKPHHQDVPQTEGKVDFDSLAETPATTVGESPTPDPEGFGGLGDTPVSVAEEQIPIQFSDGRSKRRRTQTEFYGDVSKDEDITDDTMIFTNHQKRPRPECDAESHPVSNDSDYETKFKPNIKQKRPTKKRQTRENINIDFPREPLPDPKRELVIGEIPFIPGFEHNPSWGTDGVAIWVKPHPRRFICGERYTTDEISAARYHSPGPPVCPLIIRASCHGRYPPDSMEVRVALLRRVKYHKSVRRARREFIRNVEVIAEFLKAMRLNIIPRSEKNKRKGFRKLCDMIAWKRPHVWDPMRYMECVEHISEIFASKFFVPQYEPLVDVLFEQIGEKVMDIFNDTEFSPRFLQQLERNGINWTGEHIVKFVKKVNHYSGPPFFTEEEWLQRWGQPMPKHADEVFTQVTDKRGNVIGHMEVPTLRELTTPLEPFDWLEESNEICKQYERVYYKLYPKELKKKRQKEKKQRAKHHAVNNELVNISKTFAGKETSHVTDNVANPVHLTGENAIPTSPTTSGEIVQEYSPALSTHDVEENNEL